MKTCADIEPQLFAFELGALDSSADCEAHLATCGTCLARFFEHKRVREDAAAFDERPSSLVRDRLRARVAVRSRRRPLVWAMAAAAAVALLLALRAVLATPSHERAPDAPLIDSAPLSHDLM